MNRREFIPLLAAVVAMRPDTSLSQQARKIWKIGILSSIQRPVSIEESFYGGFLEGMRERGYVETRDYTIEWRFADDHVERLPELAADLVLANVDVIVVGPTHVVAAAQKATSTIPIVMVTATDPVASGFVASLAKPGGNITGLSNQAREWVLKQLELLSSASAEIRRVGVIQNPALDVGYDFFLPLQTAGERIGLSVISFPVAKSEQVPDALAVMSRAGVKGLMIRQALAISRREEIARLAIAHKLAWMSSSREEVVAGALMSYAQNVRASYRQSASYVDRIMKGAAPADLPVQQPVKFDIVVNLKTARALGLSLPETLLARADEVIE
jgi:ABC-type uncharacterized transport system substrate-binding protein